MSNCKIDSTGIQEVGANCHNFTTSNTLSSLLRQDSDPIRFVVSLNRLETKNLDNTQCGGTAIVINNALTIHMKDTGTDHTHLGRWLWY